tara:strand:+ start:617 stop:1546 length:930 start_codon:yes stop_codon:yes gene_type:complete
MSPESTGGTGSTTDYKRLWKLYQTLGVNPVMLSGYERDVLSNIVLSDEIEESFEDIGGNEELKDNIERLVIRPTLNPSMYKGKNLLKPPNGIILYGPPGTGKTMMARAVAKKIGGYFINVTSNLIENKFYGESQKIVHAIFSIADKIKPCVVFFDEIDGLCGTRNIFDQSHVTSVKTTLLGEMDGIYKRDPGVIVFGATNRIDNLDPALKRRMRLHIKVDLPTTEARKSIIEKIIQGEPINDDVDLDKIAEDTDGLSGSDLHEICKLAAQHAMKEASDNEVADEGGEHFSATPLTINKDNFECAINDIL